MSATSGRLQELDDSCFRPDELNDVSETTSAVYAMLKFGGTGVTLFGAPVSGNIGVRWVETINESDGAVVFPNLYSITPTSDECTRALEQREPDQPADAYAANCYLSADDLAYASGTGDPRTAKTTHHHLLPSLNISFELTDDWLLRLAASKALSRPDIGLMKNYLSVRSDLPGRGTQDSDERYVTDADGKITGVNPRYLGSAYNPSLKPVTAKQFDVSLEHYFEDGGMFALAAFHKDFDDFIQYSSRDEQITQNGITRTVTVKGPLNGEGAAVYGAEASITKFFNFLPGAWSGLGLQLNASVIKNKGSNSGVKNQNGGDAGGGAAQGGTNGTTLEVDDLEGLSKYNFNLVGMYEKYGFNARLAYNWRSEYLITAVDCCTNLPTYNEGTGYLDGSISYQLTDEITVSLQGSNLLDTQPVLAQQVSDASEGSLKKSTAWLRNDRRFVLGVRARF
jgi:TonB-dependent receptor